VAGQRALAGFSPSGADVAFVASPIDASLARYLYVVEPQGALRCVSQPVGVQGFAWSPDGNLIAFSGRRGSVGRLSQTLYVANLTMRGYAQLAANVLHYEWQPHSAALAVFSIVSTTRQVALGIVRGADKKLWWVDVGVVGGKWCPE
jgi:dipeptidyl aminopeptidase/acylaminoacyl peptidase